MQQTEPTLKLDFAIIPADLKMYEKDVDLGKLKIQLQMLPDLIRIRNMRISNCVPIKRVTNVQTL